MEPKRKSRTNKTRSTVHPTLSYKQELLAIKAQMDPLNRTCSSPSDHVFSEIMTVVAHLAAGRRERSIYPNDARYKKQNQSQMIGKVSVQSRVQVVLELVENRVKGLERGARVRSSRKRMFIPVLHISRICGGGVWHRDHH